MEDKMLMNPATGSVAPESEWRKDYADFMTRGEEGIELWGGEDFEDADLVEVIKDKDGNWIEPKFFCEDCGRPYLDDGTCLSIVNERRDDVRHYCPYCTVHGRFELKSGDDVIYDAKRFTAHRFGDHDQFLELHEA